MKRIVVLLALTLLTLSGMAQQDALYSQYMFHPLAINPAYAGNKDAISAQLVYRNQWTGMQGAPRTAAFAVQAPLKSRNSGAGLELVSDKQGLQRTTGGLISYSYRIPFMSGKLSFGLRLGMFNYTFDTRELHIKDIADPYSTGAAESKLTGTGDAGLYYQSRSVYTGLGFTHLNRGKITDLSSTGLSARQSVHYFLTAGKAFQLGSVILNPSILLRGTGGAPRQADINLNVLLKERLWTGISLRSGYGLVLLTQYLVNEKMRAGYAFDWGMNPIGRLGKGTHEIMIAYDFRTKPAKVETLRFF